MNSPSRKPPRAKAVALFSGGLDSVLAVRLLMDQGIDVVALTIRLPFERRRSEPPEDAAALLGVPIRLVEVGEDYVDVLRHPRFGYGKAFNPCVDCRIYMLGVARRIMEGTGASFIVTGDVLKQRPKSQWPEALELEDRCSGLEGLVVRPLSALLLPPTIPEQQGFVDRSRLLGLSGRTRTSQLELARHYRLEKFGTPASGCPLTDEGFGRKARALFDRMNAITVEDIALLRRGRHFYGTETHFVVGRRRRENRVLCDARSPEDGVTWITECGGPVTLVRGRVDHQAMVAAARLSAAYSDAPSDAPVTVHYAAPSGEGVILVEQRSVGADARP